MVFLNKNREKGLKVFTKEKKKIQKLLEKKPSKIDETKATTTPTPTSQNTNTNPTITTTTTLNQPLTIQQQPTNNLNNVTKTSNLTVPTTTTTQKQPVQSSPFSAPWWVSDVSFTVEGRKIPAHKVVLSSRSTYFARLFQTDCPADFEVRDFTYDIFSQYVKWIYGGKKEIPPSDAAELRRCALQYESQELFNQCQVVLEQAQKQLQEEYHHQQHLHLQNQIQQIQLQNQIQQMHIRQQLLSDHHHHHHHLPSHQELNEPTYIISEIPSYTDNYDISNEPQFNDLDLENNPHIQELSAENFGMNDWSSDPVLFAPDHPSWEDAVPVMEIC